MNNTKLFEYRYPSPVEDLRIIANESGVVAILWPNETYERVGLGKVEIVKWAKKWTNSHIDLMVSMLDGYFKWERKGPIETPDLRYARGTELQKKVWLALADIPYGETVTYRDLAERIGSPRAIRAVASAVGKNPLSILLPCHRVIGTDGTLRGFAGGLSAKKWLLDFEKRYFQKGGLSSRV